MLGASQAKASKLLGPTSGEAGCLTFTAADVRGFFFSMIFRRSGSVSDAGRSFKTGAPSNLKPKARRGAPRVALLELSSPCRAEASLCVSGPELSGLVFFFYVSPTSLVVVQATALPFPDDSFDTVVQTFGLCSESDPARALAEMQVSGVAQRSLRRSTFSVLLHWQCPAHT
jgi:hypothetical protein